MTEIINIPPVPINPVLCNFWWDENGPSKFLSFDGDKYEFTYTVVDTEVEFFATKSDKPHVIAPVGVTILEYFWDFGDGTTAMGPSVVHTYRVPDPEIEVKLTVVDSRDLRWSIARPLNLVPGKFGFLSAYRIIGKSEEGGAPLKLTAKGTDKSLTTDGSPIVEFDADHSMLVGSATSHSTDATKIVIKKIGGPVDVVNTSDILTKRITLKKSASDTIDTTDAGVGIVPTSDSPMVYVGQTVIGGT
jgi:PKD domain